MQYAAPKTGQELHNYAVCSTKKIMQYAAPKTGPENFLPSNWHPFAWFLMTLVALTPVPPASAKRTFPRSPSAS